MRRRKVAPIAPEWSFGIEAADIGPAPRAVAIEAGQAEREALARRFGLIEISLLRAEVNLCREGRAVHVTGRVEADVVQPCIATLEPVPGHVSEDFEAWYADPDAALSFARARQEHERRTGQADTPVLDESEDPEPLIDGVIDLGELAAQYLSLGLDPYPHAASVGAEDSGSQARMAGRGAVEAPEPSPLRKSPFMALKDWKFTKNREES